MPFRVSVRPEEGAVAISTPPAEISLEAREDTEAEPAMLSGGLFEDAFTQVEEKRQGE